MKTLSIMGLCGAMMLSGCGGGTDSLANGKIGQRCVVQFRRDALGSAAPVPIGPDTDNINGSEVTIGGTLKKVQADAILITTDKAEYLDPDAGNPLLEVRIADAREIAAAGRSAQQITASCT